MPSAVQTPRGEDDRSNPSLKSRGAPQTRSGECVSDRGHESPRKDADALAPFLKTYLELFEERSSPEDHNARSFGAEWDDERRRVERDRAVNGVETHPCVDEADANVSGRQDGSWR
jgi:hypothetical protein